MRRPALEHLERIRQHLGFQRCDEAQRQRLLKHLTETAQALPRSEALRQETWRWLQAQRIVRPGRTTLRDLLKTAREGALQQAFAVLACGLSAEQREQLDALLVVVPAGGDAPKEAGTDTEGWSRSGLEQYKALARKESPEALLALLDRLTALLERGLATLPISGAVHPATRRLLANWGYQYEVWSLRRFAPEKCHAIVLCFLRAALAETADAVVEMQDKLITGVHNKARRRREDLLHATEEARRRAVEALEALGSLVLDDAIADADLRRGIFARLPRTDLELLVEGCRQLREGDDGSHLRFITHWYPYTRRYSPQLLEVTPFRFVSDPALGEAVAHLKAVNRDQQRKLTAEAPTGFLPRRWAKYVTVRPKGEPPAVARPYYELALLTTLNERLKSGDATGAHSRRWTDFEDYLIPRATWAKEREQHYAQLGLPLQAEEYLVQLRAELAALTAEVDRRVPGNPALTIDAQKGEFHLAALKGADKPDEVKTLKDLIESRLPRTELVDVLIDLDHRTDFLRHFLHPYGADESRVSAAERRRNSLAALIAIGCNIGLQRMAVASGLPVREISEVTDWCLNADALKAASIDLINYASRLPLSRVYGRGASCSADGVRFYVPVNLLAADYSHVLHGRGVTLYAHTADNCLRLHQQPVPCRLREAAFVLDGLLEHDTELDPRTCYIDTHGYTEVVMAIAALLGFQLAPRIRDIHDQTLYKIDHGQGYPYLDPILTGTIKLHRITPAWDEVVRLIASMRARVVSPSLALLRLGSYARQNRVHQALAEIGRIHKTVHLLRTLDNEEYRRRMGRELNKGEASHELSRFLCFGKDGALHGREFGDQLHTFSCLSVLHNAVVAWNMAHIEPVIEQLRAEGQRCDDELLSLTTPLLRRHINPFGRYHFDLARMRQDGGQRVERPPERSASERAGP